MSPKVVLPVSFLRVSQVTLLDDVSNSLCHIADAAELVRNVHPDEAYVAHASSAVQEIAGYMSEVNLDASVYQCMKDAEAEASRDSEGLSLEARTVLHHMRVSMEHEGIHLAQAEKQACIEMLDAEQQLAFDIVQRQEQARQRISSGTDGAWIPVSALGNLSLDQWRLKERSGRHGREVHVPRDTFLADRILKVVPCGEARRQMHEAQQSRDSAAEEMMVQLLAVRQQLAKIRGYPSWAHYAQREALFQSPDKVKHFLEAACSLLVSSPSYNQPLFSHDYKNHRARTPERLIPTTIVCKVLPNPSCYKPPRKGILSLEVISMFPATYWGLVGNKEI